MGKKNKKQLKLLLENRNQEKKEIYKRVRKELRKRGKFFRSSDGFAHYYDSKNNHLYEIDMKNTDFTQFIAVNLGFDRTDSLFRGVVYHLADVAYKSGEQINFFNLAHWDDDNGILYVNRFDGKMYRLDGKSIAEVELGVDGVFFNDPDWYEPYRIEDYTKKRLSKILFKKPNFQNDKKSALSPKDQAFILRHWFYGVFFIELLPTRPILIFYGEPSSWKTDTARSILKFLFGGSADVHDPPNSARDFKVVTNASKLLFIDDFDRSNRNLEKHLVRLATGSISEERTLYSNSNVTRMDPDTFLGITTKWPYFSREDFLQRCMIVRLKKMDQNKSSKQIMEAIAKHRNKLWKELFDSLNKLIVRLRKSRSVSSYLNFRMVDWGELLYRALPKKRHNYLDNLWQRINQDQIDFLTESNPLAMTLSIWLKDKKNHGKWIESGKIREDLRIIAKASNLDFSEYNNDQIFGVEMANVSSTFSRIYTVKKRRRRGRNRYKFTK